MSTTAKTSRPAARATPLKTTWAARLLPLLLALALPAAVQAQYNFTTNNGAITITGYTGAGGGVMIPGTIFGLPVVSIGVGAFQNSGLTSVTIPSSVTSIGSWALGCSGLTAITVDPANPSYSSLNGVLFDKALATLLQYPPGLGGGYTIPSGVTSIGDYAFSGCVGLTSVAIPYNVTGIGVGAFESCSALTEITVAPANPSYSSLNGVLFDRALATLLQYPAGLAGEYAIPSGVTSIGDYAFSGCSGLTSITIPSSVTSIGEAAFMSCTSITGITIPGSVTSIGWFTFLGCSSLSSITIPSSVTGIGNNAFEFCYGLTNVTIGSGVTSIGNNAFDLCGLTSVTIPSSVTNIGDYAFASCPNLISVFFQGNPPIADSTVFTGDTNATAYYLPAATGWGGTIWRHSDRAGPERLHLGTWFCESGVVVQEQPRLRGQSCGPRERQFGASAGRRRGARSARGRTMSVRLGTMAESRAGSFRRPAAPTRSMSTQMTRLTFSSSTDSTPANMRLVAQETVWSNPLQWLSSAGGSSLAQKCSDGFVPPGSPAGTAPPYASGIYLTAGSPYYLELDHWNWVGGDNCEATVTPTGSPPGQYSLPTLTGSFIGFYFPRCTYVAFTDQPVSVTNAAPFTPVTFAAGGITDSQVGIMGQNDPAPARTTSWCSNGWSTVLPCRGLPAAPSLWGPTPG